MRKLYLALLLFLSVGVRAQYCGHFGNPSGSLQCDHHILAPQGFSPISDSIPPFENGVFSSTVLQVRFDAIRFGGQLLTVQSCRIDSIGNLPSGLCWVTDTLSNTFDSTGGCIKISGTPCDYPGQYAPKIFLTVGVGIPISTTADAAGIKQFLRLKNSGDADIPVDTTQSPNNPIIVYGNAITGCTPSMPCHAFYSLAPDTTVPHKWWAINQASGTLALTYLWQWGDGTGSTGVTPSHVYAAPGNYNICLTVSDASGCSDTYCDSSTYIYKNEGMVSVNVVQQIPTGISKSAITNPQFAISPNPATTSVTISIDESMIGSTATVSDITGRRIAAVNLTTPYSLLNTAPFSNGVYFVTVSNKEGRGATKKLVVGK